MQGAILSGLGAVRSPTTTGKHSIQLLDEVRRDYRRVLIAIEGVYSMDGDFPDVPRFVEVKQRHKALLMIDEAHSVGTMGPHGRGIGEHFDIDPRIGRYLDGHAQQVVRQLRRLHRRLQGDESST